MVNKKGRVRGFEGPRVQGEGFGAPLQIFRLGGLAGASSTSFFVIPAKAGIQWFSM
jgi:hypothetical protein